MPQFQYINLLWLLLLLPLLAAIFFYARYKKQKVFQKMGDPELVKELTAGYNKSSFPIKFALVFAAIALVLLSIANLRSEEGSEKITRNGIDVMIAIDVSKSMLAQDIQPTRLDRAKQVLNRLIDKLNNDRIGIVVFAGKAYLQMPLTADHSAAKMYLSAATPETVPTQGTVIGDALKMCFASFNSKERKYKSVVLISDGEDHDEEAVKVAEQMAQEGVIINTIGIGSPQGAPIMDPATNELKKDAEGNTVITKLNEEELSMIAKKGNGNYQLFTNTDEVVNNLYGQLSTLDRRSVTDNSLANYKSWFQYLLAAALLFLIIELFISEVKNISKRKIKIAMMVILLFSGFSSSAQADKEIIKKGNDAYKKADYKTAAVNYGEAVKKNDTNTVAQYNLGNALYKNKNYEDAVNAYEKAQVQMKTPAEKSSAQYNKGVVLQNDKKLEECIEAYKTALKTDPKNADARHNLQLALKKQQQEKKDEDEKNKKDQDKKDKNNNDGDNGPPKPKPSKISQKDAEQKLQALLQKEKDLQDKLHKVNSSSPDKPEKDW
jgi:tetratricopeptide (TPR) repeat protein